MSTFNKRPFFCVSVFGLGDSRGKAGEGPLPGQLRVRAVVQEVLRRQLRRPRVRRARRPRPPAPVRQRGQGPRRARLVRARPQAAAAAGAASRCARGRRRPGQRPEDGAARPGQRQGM